MSHTMLMRNWFERVWNQSDLAAVSEYLAEDGVIEGVSAEAVAGPENFCEFQKQFRANVHDMKIEVIDIIEEGDKVSGCFNVTGIHARTKKSVSFHGHFFGLIKDGKIIHAHNSVDYLTFLTQIGAINESVMSEALT